MLAVKAYAYHTKLSGMRLIAGTQGVDSILLTSKRKRFMMCSSDSNIDKANPDNQEPYYLQYFCRECMYHFHDVFANGICEHQEVCMEMPDYCRACRRFKYRKEGYDEDSV